MILFTFPETNRISILKVTSKYWTPQLKRIIQVVSTQWICGRCSILLTFACGSLTKNFILWSSMTGTTSSQVYTHRLGTDKKVLFDFLWIFFCTCYAFNAYFFFFFFLSTNICQVFRFTLVLKIFVAKLSKWQELRNLYEQGNTVSKQLKIQINCDWFE